MSILINSQTQVLIQGITGKEGSRAAREMKRYGTHVLAGVTPGKGGQVVEDVLVFNSVKEAVTQFPSITISLIVVPPAYVLGAASEALEAGIKLINILTEKVPVGHIAKLIRLSSQYGARIIGPSSVGIISPGKAKIGSIGSSERVNEIFTHGPIGVISKSGGMTAEICHTLSQKKLGQSTALGIGGDPLIASDFLDIALLFEKDIDTKVIVIFGEVGGTYEEKLADAIRKGIITKPVVALIAGRFSESLPEGTVLGHAGAIVLQGKGSYTSKINALKSAGAHVVSTPEEIPTIVRSILKK